MSRNDANKDAIAFIPARGGSQRVTRKNLRLLGGKPLLQWAVDVANASDLFTEIVVDSDDAEILEVGGALGATPEQRSPELGQSDVKIIDVLQHFINRRGLRGDRVIGVLLPTTPLRSVRDLSDAHQLFLDHDGTNPIVSVATFERPVRLAQRVNSEGRLEPLFPDDYARSTRSQDQEVAYWYNGAIIFNSAGRFLAQRNLIGETPVPYVMPLDRSIDVDHEVQLEMLEAILTLRTEQSAE
ncbi:cytidylyltransferase domain-containing protein [Gemmatimonadota bacterium]